MRISTDDQHREVAKLHLRSVTALLDSLAASVSDEESSLLRYSSYATFARKYNQVVDDVSKSISIPSIVDRLDLDKLPLFGRSTSVAHKGIYDSIRTNLHILKSHLENLVGVREGERNNLKNFLKASLRRAIFDTPDREKQVQDCVEQILIGRGLIKGIDYDREAGRVKISIKESIPDFVFPKLNLALEIKLSKDVQKSRDIVDEINADIRSYSTKYQALIFLVYDVGSIRDEVEFAHGLESTDNISVIVVKH